jgi:hypothetical protein
MCVCVYERNTPGVQLELGGLASDIIIQPAKTTRISYSAGIIPVCRTDTTYIPGTVHKHTTAVLLYNITYFTRVKSYIIIVQLVQVDGHYTAPVVGCPTTAVMHIIKNTALLYIINTAVLHIGAARCYRTV